MNKTNKSLGAYLGGHLRENGMLMALVAIVLFFWIVVRVFEGVDFLSAQNITNLFLQNSYVIIMALGMLLVIVAGHIDLSVGSVVGFVGAVVCGVWVGGVGKG
jgi:putative multiple sugar transport system permease protein